MTQIEQLITYVTSENRICPNPIEWDRVSRIIDVSRPGHKCVPLILAGWAFSSDQQKRDRVIDQIKFAQSMGEDVLQKFAQSLYELKKEDWYCGSEPLSTWQWDGK